MREIKKSIRDEVSRLAATSQSDYDVALARQQEIKKQLGEAVSKSRASDSAEIALRDMKTKAKTYRNLYETFQHRYMGAMQQNSFPILEARVIYPALPPDRTSKPNERLILALGAFGGLAFGLAMGLLKDMMDRSVRTPAHVEKALQLPCLSIVPRTRAPKALKADRIEARRLTVNACQQVVLTGNSIDSTVVCMPMSRFTETIRSVKMGIDLNPIKTANKVIGVISALPHEGKTTIASSLVQLIAHSGKRAIIVDCDLKKPSLSASLAPNVTVGIIEVVSGTSLLEDAICRDVKTGFDLLPVARRNPMFHTNEVLASDKMRRLFDQLRAVYDYVIVDLPPLSPIVDARAAALFTDCFVLVIEWGHTKIEVVQHALNTAPNVYENIAGVVLNKTDFNRMGHYDSSLRDYYDESHYARYADKP
jgi:capsular exopolysaccharide synthesis family protein